MTPDHLFGRYRELQEYVGWTDDDARRVAAAGPPLAAALAPLVDDFYDEIDRHPNARKVITGGREQVERLKGTLIQWLRELLSGRYDEAYVARRWRVGWRHVEIGLDQVYTNVALSRLRTGLLRALDEAWPGSPEEFRATSRALNKLLDLDLAIIEDAYQAEHLARQQRAERLAERERSEAAFRTLVEAAPCLIVILRSDGSIAYFNDFAGQLTGYTAPEVLARDYFTLFLAEEDRTAVAEQVRQVFAGVPARGREGAIRGRAAGSRCWVVWDARLLPDYRGAPAVMLVGQDIGPLKTAQEQALQSARLAAIGQMMTGLAHESGNALARSQACLEMLALEVPDRPDALDLIRRIQKAQDHLRQLYEEVRGYAAPVRLEREVWDVSGVWRQAWANLSVQRQGRNAELREQTAGADLRCTVDHFRLEQVFRNMFENSLAACRDPVRLIITCEGAEVAGRPALRIAVRDNGPGLSAEQRQRIFDPFYTTKTKGTGLGMAIAKRIVEAHEGQLAVGSAAGPGAEIHITLPRDVP
jgi:PAS domain S-box-containing protein